MLQLTAVPIVTLRWFQLSGSCYYCTDGMHSVTGCCNYPVFVTQESFYVKRYENLILNASRDASYEYALTIKRSEQRTTFRRGRKSGIDIQ